MLGFKGLRKLRLKEVHSGDLSRGLRFIMKTPGRGGTLGISGWGCATRTWNPQPIPELVQLNFATLH